MFLWKQRLGRIMKQISVIDGSGYIYQPRLEMGFSSSKVGSPFHFLPMSWGFNWDGFINIESLKHQRLYPPPPENLIWLAGKSPFLNTRYIDSNGQNGWNVSCKSGRISLLVSVLWPPRLWVVCWLCWWVGIGVRISIKIYIGREWSEPGKNVIFSRKTNTCWVPPF